MNRAALIGGVFAGSKQRRRIEQTRFVVTADSHEGIRALHLAEDRFAEVFRRRRAWISAKKRAADAQIKDDTRSGAQVRIENRSRAAGIGRKPSLYSFALWHGRQAAGIAEHVVRESRMNRCELLERVPSRGFADCHVR